MPGRLGAIDAYVSDEGEYTATSLLPNGPSLPSIRDLKTGDLDGDGDLDLVISASEVFDDRLLWVENLGDSFAQPVVIHETTVGLTSENTIAVGDLNDDGRSEVLLALEEQDSVLVFRSAVESPIRFVEPTVVVRAPDEGVRNVSSVFATDLDGDGDLDVVSATTGDDRIAWHENQDGLGAFGRQAVIAERLGDATQIRAADIDGDGDDDLVVSESNAENGSLTWLEQSGSQQFQRRPVDRDLGRIAYFHLGDFDQDEDVDMAYVVNENTVAWAENDGRGLFSIHEIDLGMNIRPTDMLVHDIDNDGRLEFIIASATATQIIEVNDVANRFEIADRGNGTSLAVADIDSDGDDDILLGQQRGGVQVLRNLGNGDFVAAETFASQFTDIRSLQVADLNGDGVAEILILSRRRGELGLASRDENGSYQTEIVADGRSGSFSGIAGSWADVDADGRIDLVFGTASTLGWRRNNAIGDELSLDAPRPILESMTESPVLIDDIDADGRRDIVAATRNRQLSVYFNRQQGYEETPLAIDTSWNSLLAISLRETRKLVATTISGEVLLVSSDHGAAQISVEVLATLPSISNLLAVDLDGDDDEDIVFTLANERSVGWFENIDGDLKSAETVVEGIDAASLLVGDWDGDTRAEIITVSDGGELTRHTDSNGDGRFDRVVQLAVGVRGQDFVSIDLNSDGLQDVVTLALNGDLVWLRNELMGFATLQTVKEIDLRTLSLHVSDLNLDGRDDLILMHADSVSWLQNRAQGLSSPVALIANVPSLTSLAIGDIDGDSDFDLVTSSIEDGQVRVFRNQLRAVAVRGDVDNDAFVNHADVELLCSAIRGNDDDLKFDINRDQQVSILDLDFLIGDVLGSGAGDANLDGVFTTSDLVQVFQAGKYERLTEQPLTWAEGDWNCDGVFNSADLVAAFQRGWFSE